ncbi:hypothetical protein ACIPSE_43215 [Streptomyces sp. NPDC090106]|uniref:rhamnogalacturonan lyase family protein n=1 Tax=Streptomyces sp. NPDC090106 TaxID=3365946 RepID=UPI00382A6E39
MHIPHRHKTALRTSPLALLAGLALTAALLTGLPSPDRPGAIALGSSRAVAAAANGPREMERLGRGVVAVRTGDSSVFVSWRLLALDPQGIGFNVYRSTAGGGYQKLNSAVLMAGTNYTDTTADPTETNTYRVRPVVNGTEQAASGAFALSADHATEPVVRIPLRAGAAIKYVWVGDLDGDGEYDYVVDRHSTQQSLEAYLSDGTFLWSMDLGPNSEDQDNIEGGSSAIDVGSVDGVTVYDLDGDGRSEVAVRIANGVTFGNGRTFTSSDDDHQFITVVDGMTGAERATSAVPDDYIADGPMHARFEVGYLNGRTPSLVAYMKNRVGDGNFNLMMTAWRFDGTTLSRQWKWLRGDQNAPDGHQSRIIDVDGDGKDEVVEIGFVLNGDGTLRYSLGEKGIVHGDRYYIAKMDPDRPGLQGYGIQQDNPSGLLEYYYDATDGTILWQHTSDTVTDVGRGLVGDIDPRHRGMEAWSFYGIHHAATNKLVEADTTKSPWPAIGLWWDGDRGMELLNSGRIEKWDFENPADSSSQPRLVSTWKYGAVGTGSPKNPAFFGDILGDWREEAVYPDADNDELIVFTTGTATEHRIYTLAQNPAYRNDMTVKGYLQSHELDYYLGRDMTTPPVPDIVYAD